MSASKKLKQIISMVFILAPLLLSACMALPNQVRPDEQTSQTGTPASGGTDELVYSGPPEMGSSDTSKCASLRISATGEATLSACDGTTTSVALGERAAQEWRQLRARFGSFTYETETEKLLFAGQGDAPSEPWQRAMLLWARVRHAELAAGGASATGNTVLSWYLGQDYSQKNICMHLTVLGYGYAQAEEILCEGQDVVSMSSDWLTNDELAALDAWLYARAPFYADNNYIDGRGAQAISETESATIDAWAMNLWTRIRAEGHVDLARGNGASQSTALDAESGEDPAPAIRWHREGGFAGFCDDIAIGPMGDVTISTCLGNQSQELAHIHLDAGQQATLNDWLVQLQSFKLEHKDPAVADALAVRVQFNGVGNAVASAAEKAAIADFAQNLLNGLGETPAALMGAVYTNAQSGLSLQYPADAVRFENARPAVDGALAQLPNVVSFINGEPNFALTITWFDLAADATLRSFIDAHSECPDTTATGGQPFQIDGGEALIFPNAPCGPYGGTYLFTLVESRGYRFTIESMASYDEIRGNVEAILNSVHFTPFHAAESAPARCLPPTDDARLLLEGANGYCLLYPHSYIAAHLPDGATELVTQSLMNHTDPRVSIAVEEANGRTLEQVAADWESIYAHQGIDSQRGSITVDGVAAMMLDNLPGQDLNRRVVLVHNDRVYSFFFTPLGDEGDARANMEAFYQDILDSFRFLEAVVVQPLPRPDAADVVETDVQFIRALVNVNMRSGPGATYGIVGSVFAGQTAQVTGAMPDGSWWRVICPDGSTGSCFVVNDPSLTQPAARPEDAASLSDTGEAIVENLSVNLLESFPVQVHAVVRGHLPDACSFIESTGVNVEGTTFHIRMTTARHPNQRCAPMPTPFEEVVPLGAAGLPAGEYVVRVNELTATFTLSVDNGSTSAAETLVYEDTAAGFAFDYPATWTVSGGESGARGAITQLAAPDGTQLDVAVLAWDPQNDLDAYVATRKIAWEASGITILQADAWTLGSGQAAMHFVIRGADGASTGFYLFAALSTRYLTLSGSGDFDVLDAIGQSLRITE